MAKQNVVSEEPQTLAQPVQEANGKVQEQPFTGLTLSEEPLTEQVRIKSRDGVLRNYTVREMMGDGLAKWNVVESRRTRFDTKTQSVVSNTDFVGYHATLIALCLYDDAGNPVPTRTIQAWSSSTQVRLFELCQRLNGLVQDREDQEKKD